MKPELSSYAIFPKVIPQEKSVVLTIQPKTVATQFTPSLQYNIRICALGEKTVQSVSVSPCSDGCLRFTVCLSGEQEHYIRIYQGDTRIVQLSVYSIAPDLVGRYPYMGDLHMHTNRSDGQEPPIVVAANYRTRGYDFMAITDHHRYYSSLEAIDFYKDTATDLSLLAGEEVHLPKNDIHIVNFGGEYSVNALIDGRLQSQEVGNGEEKRVHGNVPCPAVISEQEYIRQVNLLADTLSIPAGIDAFSYAACVWIFNHIRAAKGLGIFCHPYWMSDVFQVPEAFTEYMMETQPFDAFEVLGGERYYQQNGFQTAKYYQDREKGRIYPIVGSTDTHCSLDSNRGAFIARTIVFAPSTTKDSLVSSIKNLYSVAVDAISEELRLVGEFRLIKYGWFLLSEYFPLHDALCQEEGHWMTAYSKGDGNAAAKIAEAAKKVQDLRNHTFYFEQ